VLSGEATDTNSIVLGLTRSGLELMIYRTRGLTPNEQYEELAISKNSGKPYKNTNFDKEDILANH
jgi:hypothetical protein